MRKLVLAGILTAAVTTSCLFGDDDDGDSTSYTPIDQIATSYKDALCTHYAACGLFPDKAACLSAQVQLLFDLDPNLPAAFYAGLVQYNGSKAKECIDAYAARTCDKTSQAYREIPQACYEFYRGTKSSGESCILDQECISQSCSGGGGETCSPGVCIGDTAPVFTPGQVGESCTSGLGCVPGAYCDTVTDLCTLLKAQGASCTLDSECAYGLGCVGATSTRTCGTLPALGQPCNTDGLCRDVGHYCDFTLNMCKQVGLPPTACTSSSQCSTYYPCNFTTSQCAKGPSVGMPCSSSNRCFDIGTFCDFNMATPICVAARAAGSPCNSDEECQSQSCDFSASTPICSQPMTCSF